jgi:hypothetical protein
MFAVGALNKRRPPAARIIASTLAFHLDDVGAKVGQHLSGPGSGKDAGKFKDAEAR